MTTVTVTDDGEHVAVLTIDRPTKRNALDEATYAALADALRRADADARVRVIVLTGAGSSFTAGNDLADFVVDDGDVSTAPGPQAAVGLLDALVDCDTPIVAAVEGHAVGIGTTMLLHCALAFAGAASTFRMPFTPLGLTPEGGSTLLLPRSAGSRLAAELLLTGDAFDAETAARAGLVNRVVDEGAALETALETAARLANLPASALRETWSLLRPDRDEVRAAVRREIAVFGEQLAGDEAQSIIRGFLRR